MASAMPTPSRLASLMLLAVLLAVLPAASGRGLRTVAAPLVSAPAGRRSLAQVTPSGGPLPSSAPAALAAPLGAAPVSTPAPVTKSGTPVSAGPDAAAPKDAAPKADAAASKDAAPKDAAPKDAGASKDAAPKDAAPKDAVKDALKDIQVGKKKHWISFGNYGEWHTCMHAWHMPRGHSTSSASDGSTSSGAWLEQRCACCMCAAEGASSLQQVRRQTPLAP